MVRQRPWLVVLLPGTVPFDDRLHFDPPHRVEPTRLAAALRDLWTRMEST